MKQVSSWRPPLWVVAILMGCTLALGTGAGYVQGAANAGECTESAEICQKFGNFWKVWDIAETKFLDPKAINPDQMIDGAINGMLDSLNDQGHTRYQSAEEFKQMQASLNGKFEGIGATLTEEGGVVSILAPIEGSPAEKAGIQAGDIILKINGENAEGLSVEDVVRRVRGPAGTSVTLQVQHLNQEAPAELTITRAEIELPAVTWKMLPGKVAHIKLLEFQSKAKDAVRQAVAEAKAQGAQKILFDVRNNPGGLLDQAVAVSSQFLPKDQVVLRVRDRDGNEKLYKANEDDPETELPMVVLINSGSASSAEIFAGALKDHGRAQVIGVQTRGLGTVLSPVQLDDGSAVYIGTAEWLTPKGQKIRHEGVKPDISVGLTVDSELLTPTTAKNLSDEEILRTKDAQVQRALSVLGVNVAGEVPTAVTPR